MRLLLYPATVSRHIQPSAKFPRPIAQKSAAVRLRPLLRNHEMLELYEVCGCLGEVGVQKAAQQGPFQAFTDMAQAGEKKCGRGAGGRAESCARSLGS